MKQNKTSKITFIAALACMILAAPSATAQWDSPGIQQISHGIGDQPQILGFGGALLEFIENEQAASGTANGLKFSKQGQGVSIISEAYMHYQTNFNLFVFSKMGTLNDKKFTIDVDNGDIESVGKARIEGGVGIGVNAPASGLEVNGIVNINRASGNTALQVKGLEALWLSPTDNYFSWGFGGEYNFFADEVRIGGSGVAAPAFQLEVVGDADIFGELTAKSDRRLKKNIEPINQALVEVARLNPVHYDFRTDEYPDLHLPTRHKMGFIAQEMESVLPTLVSEGGEVTDSAGETFASKSVNYMEIIPLLTKAIQEQQAMIEELTGTVAILKAQVEQSQGTASASSRK